MRVAGKRVQIGIDAPQEVPVHRDEVAERIDSGHDASEYQALESARPPRINGAARARIDAAAMGLNRLHRMLESGDLRGAEATIFKVFRNLKAIDRQVEPGRGAPSRGDLPQCPPEVNPLQTEFHLQCQAT